MSLVLEVFKDNITGGIQVSLSDLDEQGRGTGYRILGPKFLGDSSLLVKRTLDSHDIDCLHRMTAPTHERPTE
jgi:hypothetical protein